MNRKAQRKYDKENMKPVKASYKSDFVEEYEEALKILNITKSSDIRQMMEKTIEKANKQR